VIDIRPHPRKIEPAEILEPDGDDIDTVSIRREHSSGVEQRLFHLVIRSEPHFTIQVQLPSPKRENRLQRLGGEGRADRKTERGAQILIVLRTAFGLQLKGLRYWPITSMSAADRP
jgi:hypothetical protein